MPVRRDRGFWNAGFSITHHHFCERPPSPNRRSLSSLVSDSATSPFGFAQNDKGGFSGNRDYCLLKLNFSQLPWLISDGENMNTSTVRYIWRWVLTKSKKALCLWKNISHGRDKFLQIETLFWWRRFFLKFIAFISRACPMKDGFGCVLKLFSSRLLSFCTQGFSPELQNPKMDWCYSAIGLFNPYLDVHTEYKVLSSRGQAHNFA